MTLRSRRDNHAVYLNTGLAGGPRTGFACGLAAVIACAMILGSCDDEDAPASGAGAAANQYSEAKGPQDTQVHFDVDPALIGESQRFEDFGIQFSAPAGWAPLPADQVAAVAAAAMGQRQGATSAPATRPTGEFAAEPLAVYSRAEEGLWLIVSAVNVESPAAYEQALRKRHGQLSTDHYDISGIDGHQYLFQTQGLVNLKVLLSAPDYSEQRRLQLDYVLPMQAYQQKARVLESSIGSVRPVAPRDR